MGKLTSCRCCTTRPYIYPRLSLLYNILPATDMLYSTTNGQKFATSQHPDMSRCWALRCGKSVVELLWARPLVVSVGCGVSMQHARSQCPCSGVWALHAVSYAFRCNLVVMHKRDRNLRNRNLRPLARLEFIVSAKARISTLHNFVNRTDRPKF